MRSRPFRTVPALSKLAGCEVYLKCEHLQHTGSFQFRGAWNKARLLDVVATCPLPSPRHRQSSSLRFARWGRPS
nr:pyridoxal-phosphate dependent enzyme [Paraburkholderia ribeironis]